MSFPNSVDPGTVRDGVRDAQVFISGEEPYRWGLVRGKSLWSVSYIYIHRHI